MATPPAAGADRAWRGLALSVTALAHAVSLGAALLDGDRLLLVRNPALHSFGGLLALLSDGRVVARGVALPLRDRAPLGALATWLSWQWFRGGAAAQHCLSVALLVGVAAALFDLLRAARASAPLAAAVVLAFALSPATADLSAAVAHRDALLALALALLAARRAHAAAAGPAVAWSAGAALAAGLCAPGYGLLGLVAAGLIRHRPTRVAALGAAIGGAAVALSVTRGDGPWLPPLAALTAGNAASLRAALPSATPFVAASVATLPAAWMAPLLLAAAALAYAARVDDPDDVTLLRAGAGALAASTLGAGAAGLAPVVDGAASGALLLGLALALAGALRTARLGRGRPWMLVAFALPAAVTVHRAAGWSDEAAALGSIVARSPDDPESALARAALEIKRRRLDAAAPWCERYARAAPDAWRADGCLGALAAARGDHAAAAARLRRWSDGLGDRRALRAGVLELADALPDPRFAAAFRDATGFALPQRRPGESP